MAKYLLILLWAIYFATCANGKASKDPYKVLGVKKGCAEDEIRKAYRRQSLQHHPDKPTGSEAKFKELNEAYDILSDPEKRQRYDRFGQAGLDPHSYGGMPGGGESAADFAQFFGQQTSDGRNQEYGDFSAFFGGNNADLNDILRHMMAGMPDQTTAPKRTAPKPIIKEAPCSLEELYLGATKKYKVRFRGGDAKLYTIQLKRGWKSGTKVSFSKPMPVTFVIQEKRHPHFSRQGDHIVYRHPIREKNIAVPLLDGSTWERTLPSSTSFRKGEKLTVPGLGMPIKGGPTRGDLIIEFV